MKKKTHTAQQDRSRKTRQKLVLAATESLVKYNLNGLRFSQIAKMAKVPQPLMDYHFPNLDSLLNEMFLLQVAKLKEVMLTPMEHYASNPKKALAAYVGSVFVLSEKDPGFRAVWSLFYHLASTHPQFAAMNAELRKTGRERVAGLVSMTLMMESKRAKYTPQMLARFAEQIQSIVIGYGFIATEPGADSKKLSAAAVDACFRILGIEP
jgi:AcrR family transcriptional regulator